LLAAASDGEPVAAFDEVNTASEDELNEGRRRRIVRDTLRTLAQAVDGRDPSTQDHSANVSELATMLARVLDLPEEQVHTITLAALLHDVGKVGLRDEVLFKHSELTAEECIEVAEHVVLGEMILAPASIDEILPAVRHHHERWDGTGYPDGLAGHDIPIEARLLSICNDFDTLSSGRASHPPLGIEEALTSLEEGADTRYDPVILSAFVRLVRGLRAPGVSPVRPASGPGQLNPDAI
jgi:putative nucleotidyltransferase with HDIG domain